MPWLDRRSAAAKLLPAHAPLGLFSALGAGNGFVASRGDLFRPFLPCANFVSVNISALCGFVFVPIHLFSP
jgi:hypothetical protein